MCGIAGFVDFTGSDSLEALERSGLAMAEALRHRGPDDRGVWIDPYARAVLAHRRLAVLDLSSAGHQPMASASGRWMLSFNGEIYNFRALRHELERLGHGFRGHSDTEVLLAAVEQWGTRGALERCNGMFSLALWDRREQLLTLARDRLGEKPLYFGRVGSVGRSESVFVFGSELKALRVHPAFDAAIDRESIALFLRYSYVPGPRSIYAGIHKLGAGEMLVLDCSGSDSVPHIESYWSLASAARRGVADAFPAGAGEEAVDELDAVLGDAVGLRLEADTAIGAFLSGGVDSSLIVALMQKQSSRQVRTFSVGFEEDDYDEARFAREVARHLGTDHTELYVPATTALEHLPRIAEVYDEPFADPSQLPTMLLCAMASEHVTVALSGDGGDELFAGYRRYAWAERAWRAVGWLPAPGRRLIGRGLSRPGAEQWTAVGEALQPFAQGAVDVRFGDRVGKLANLVSLGDREAVYRDLMSQWKHPSSLAIGAAEPPTRFTDVQRAPVVDGELARMLYLDTLTYLPDDILVKVDRASMASSLEVRVPLLDSRVVELAWRFPDSLKVHGGVGKWPLRRVLDRYVPPELVDRPKKGFDIPLSEWLRGPLRAWGETLLAEDRLRDEGFIDPLPVRKKWEQHLAGTRNWHYPLWNILMFQAWLEGVRSPPRLREPLAGDPGIPGDRA
jgi:asparagine synthase (glutamine-hydrolysing)